VVAGGRQPFVFACPNCQTAIHGVFHASLEPLSLRTESDDVELTAAEDTQALAVAIATDLPVHLALVGVQGAAAMLSPFILASQELGLDETTSLVEVVDRLRALREHVFSPARRAAGFWAERDVEGLKTALASAPGGDAVDWSDTTPMDSFDELLGALYEPLERPGIREPYAEEFFRYSKVALDKYPQALTELFADFDAAPLPEHRRRVVQTAFSTLDDIDALFPALWAERMDGCLNLDDYRVMRDDFATRKSGYQDLFELASRTLAFTVPIANLANRGNICAYVDGKTRTPAKARKAKAYERERWLCEYPLAGALYAAVSRSTRNDIGHALVRLDVGRGILVYDDGTEQNYMLFLIDMLQAVRLSRYLFDMLQLLDYTRMALRHSQSH
jgi:hypothetical protein